MAESGFTARGHLLKGGDALWKEGEVTDKAYLVDEGRVALFRDGKQIGELLPGEMVGCTAVLLEVPQLFTVKGVPKLSILKEYTGHNIRHAFSTGVDDLVRALWGGVQAERREVELLAARHQSQGDPTALVYAVRVALKKRAEELRARVIAG